MGKRNTAKSIPRKLLILSQKSPFEFIEAYKSLRTNLQFASIDNTMKKIVITSSVPGEGKSTVAINLAITLAENGSRVLLIDADLRKPSIHKYLSIRSDVIGGVTSIISGNTTAEKCIAHFNDINISVLTSGPIPPNPAEIIGSANFKSMVDSLSAEYDYIIFDTPPVSVVTDAAVLSSICDGVILVVRQGVTTFNVALQSKENLTRVNANIIGCVFNAFEAEKVNRSYKYYSYKKYGYGYGYEK